MIIKNALDLLEFMEHMEADGYDLEKVVLVVETEGGEVYDEGIDIAVQKAMSYASDKTYVLNLRTETT